jgi:hypothetical protein
MNQREKDEIAAQHLEAVRKWAKDKIKGQQEPPWAWFQYMKLVEVSDTILEARKHTEYFDDQATPKESSPQSEQHQGKHLRLVVPTCLRDTSQHHLSEIQVPLPM